MITRRALFGLLPAAVLAPVVLLAKPSDGVTLKSVSHPWMLPGEKWYLKEKMQSPVFFYREHPARYEWTHVVVQRDPDGIVRRYVNGARA